MRMPGLKSIKVLNILARVYHCLRDIHLNSVSSITSAHPFHPLPFVERLHFSVKRTVLKLCFSLAKLSLTSDALCISLCQKDSSQSFPRQWRIGRCLSAFQVVLGHISANAVKATAGGWSTATCACLTFPLRSHTSRDRQEGSGYHLHEHRRLTAEER